MADGERKPLPTMERGIGYCTSTCPHHDGKRCELTGFRPDSICEPWVAGVVAEIKRWRAAASRAAGRWVKAPPPTGEQHTGTRDRSDTRRTGLMTTAPAANTSSEVPATPQEPKMTPEELRALVIAAGMEHESPAKVAKRVGFSRIQWWRLLNGKTPISERSARLIHAKLKPKKI